MKIDLPTAKANASIIHERLLAAEAEHPDSRSLARLHLALQAGLGVLAAHLDVAPSVILPQGGTNKP